MIDFNITHSNLADFPASVSSNLVPRTTADDDETEINDLHQGVRFFRLSPTDPKQGFTYLGEKLPGHTYPPNHVLDLHAPPESDPGSQSLDESDRKRHRGKLHHRLFLAAQFADFLRNKVKETYNYTASAGISTTKLTAKLAGSVNKPDKQTLLIPDATQKFLDGHEIGKIPGIGYKTASKLREELLGITQGGAGEGSSVAEVAFYDKLTYPVTVRDARLKLSLERLSKLLDSKEQACKVYGWLHGVDTATVATASLIPTQISIEDTFRSLQGTKQVEKVLVQLVAKLLTRMHKDLLTPSPMPTKSIPLPTTTQQRWLAFPRTFRLSIRPRNMTGPYSARISKSTPLPNYLFARNVCSEALAVRFVREVGMPLLRRMGKSGEGELQLVNVAVVNIEEPKEGGAVMAGVDIEKMFVEKNKNSKNFRLGDGKEVDWEQEVREIERVYRMLEGEKGSTGNIELAKEITDGIPSEESSDCNVLGVEAQVPINTHPSLQFGEDLRIEDDEDGKKWNKHEDRDDSGAANLLPPISSVNADTRSDPEGASDLTSDFSSDFEMEDDQSVGEIPCPKCGMRLLLFAIEAHYRFHELEMVEGSLNT